jgi:uncharacterized protein YbjT (DUF2867 family)
MGSIGTEGVLQRIAINAAAQLPSIEHVTRLSVLNTSVDSLGINQRAHYNIDPFASSTAVPYSTIRPAIFSASLLAPAREARAPRTWTALAGTGRIALIDHRDMAEAGVRVLTDPALWGAPQRDRTGFHVVSGDARAAVGEARRARHLPGCGRAAVPRAPHRRRSTGGVAELLITREWAILAGENDYTTGTFQQITGRATPSRRVPSRPPRGIRLMPASSSPDPRRTADPGRSWLCQCSFPSHLNAERDGRKKYSPPRSTLKVSISFRDAAAFRNTRLAFTAVPPG